jgi:hypothetical protein
MSGLRTGLVVGLVAFGLVATARWTILAQERRERPDLGTPRPDKPPGFGDLIDVVTPVRTAESKAKIEGKDHEPPVSIQDALERPFILPFGTPTRLEDVCAHLRRILHAPVVLDRAALQRQDVRADDTIELELHGVRLKTGLKLLLDQVGLTYRVEPGDNLLIVTDDEGADDPLHRVLAELKALHRDLHDVQDSVEEIRATLGLDEGGPKMRKPTIIEELPDAPAEKKAAPSTPQPRSRHGV